MKTTGKVLLSVIFVAVLFIGGFLLKIALFPVNTASKAIDMSYGIVDKTLTADNAIYNYEWFKRQYQSIESLKRKELAALEAVNTYKLDLPSSRSEWTRDDKTEYDRLNSIVNGLGNQLSDAVAEYNARSGMVNRAIFKDDLPSNITTAILDGLELIKK